MRPIHLILGTSVIAIAIILFAGPSHSKNNVLGTKQQQINDQPLCGDAQCVPSIIGEDQFEGIHSKNNSTRRYVFPRLHKQKAGNDGENN